MKSISQFINERKERGKRIATAKNMIIGGKEFSSVKTFGIVTSENPDSQNLSNAQNRFYRRELQNILKRSKLNYTMQGGNFGGNKETSYIIFNPSFETMKYIAGEFEQTSFFYCYVTDDGVKYEYYEKEDTDSPYDDNRNDYVMKDSTSKITMKSDANDNYSFIGKDFKYSIDLSIFEDFDNRMTELITEMAERTGRTNESVISITMKDPNFTVMNYRIKTLVSDVDESYDDEMTVVKSNDIVKDIQSFMKWYNDIFEGDNEVNAVKVGNKDVWALERDGEVLLYIDKNGLIYADNKLKRRCGDIYNAYDALDRYGFPAY